MKTKITSHFNATGRAHLPSWTTSVFSHSSTYLWRRAQHRRRCIPSVVLFWGRGGSTRRTPVPLPAVLRREGTSSDEVQKNEMRPNGQDGFFIGATTQ